jgi:hypothetical protein
MKSLCKSQFLHKSVKLSFILVIMMDELTELCGNRLLRNDLPNTFCEIKLHVNRRLDRMHGLGETQTYFFFFITPKPIVE